jgi:hypothetical protein
MFSGTALTGPKQSKSIPDFFRGYNYSIFLFIYIHKKIYICSSNNNNNNNVLSQVPLRQLPMTYFSDFEILKLSIKLITIWMLNDYFTIGFKTKKVFARYRKSYAMNPKMYLYLSYVRYLKVIIRSGHLFFTKIDCSLQPIKIHWN